MQYISCLSINKTLSWVTILTWLLKRSKFVSQISRAANPVNEDKKQVEQLRPLEAYSYRGVSVWFILMKVTETCFVFTS